MKKIKKQRNIVKELRQKKSSIIQDNPAASISLDNSKNKPDYNTDDIVLNDSTGNKVSDILLDYASPFIAGLKDEELRRMLIIVAMAWNISLLPKEKRGEHIAAILKDSKEVNSQSYEKGIELINYMVKRKDDLYAACNYYIQDYELKIIDGDPYLAVVSEEI
jgi:hypothetical protein